MTRYLNSDAGRGYLLLLAICLLLATEKISFTRHAFGPLPDGGYYMNIAQHVRDGDGLVTDLSLAYKGAPYLPYPTDMYPLWPLLYGYLSRVFPLEATGHWLPTIFYFTAIALGYVWARGLVPRPLFPKALPSFNAGHVLAIVLGLDSEFFRYTSYPYTEGLTYVLVFLALWRFNRIWRRPSLRTGLELGAWLALTMLCRKQMFIMTLAAATTLAGAVAFGRGHRRAWLVTAAAAAVAWVAVLLPHFLYVASFTPDLGFGLYMRWDQLQHTKVLAPLPTLTEVPTLGAYLKDRFAGFKVAFGTGKMSYTNQYYVFQYAILVALPLVPPRLWQLRRELRPRLRELFAPASMHWVFVVVFALAGFFSIHTMHMHTEGSWEWAFAGRHALTSIFVIVLSLMLLLCSGSFPWTAAGVFLLCTGTYLGVVRVRQWSVPAEDDTEPPPSPLVEWINGERAARDKLVVALRQPQYIAHLTPGVGYHWFHAKTTFKDVCAMTSQLGVDYVVAKGARFAADPAFKAAFELVDTVATLRIYRPAPGGACAPAPPP